jgi:hypothetical protein
MKVSVLRYAAIGMATLSLAGFAAASTVNIGTTGPQSNNHVSLSNSNKASLDNYNNVGAANLNSQYAQSGDVKAADNTTVGGAASGAAKNSNATTTDVTISNAGLGDSFSAPTPSNDSVSLSQTGPQSDNNVKIDNSNSVKVSNNNNVFLLNASEQSAASGNAEAKDNTTAGGVSSGDASNSNTTMNDLTISN